MLETDIMILSTKCLFGSNINSPTARDIIFWGAPEPSQGIPWRRLSIALILTAAVSLFLLDALEDMAAGWNAEMRLGKFRQLLGFLLLLLFVFLLL